VLVLCIVAQTAKAQHDMSRMGSTGASPVVAANLARIGSGTAWLPDAAAVPMPATRAGAWTLMAHARAFGTFDRQWTLHGDTRAADDARVLAEQSAELGSASVRDRVLAGVES
jgi:hypothetical protein